MSPHPMQHTLDEFDEPESSDNEMAFNVSKFSLVKTSAEKYKSKRISVMTMAPLEAETMLKDEDPAIVNTLNKSMNFGINVKMKSETDRVQMFSNKEAYLQEIDEDHREDFQIAFEAWKESEVALRPPAYLENK